jgi:mannose/fructose/N-acetylgalactosamine-specific phosphotransferase system component IIB
MDPSEFRVILDDRPLHETAVAAWCDAADIDVVWWCTTAQSAEAETLDALPAPVLLMSPIDVAAASLEAPTAGLRVLILVDDIATLLQAIRLGLPPMRLVVANYASDANGRRLSPEVSLDLDDHRQLASLFSQGFELILQSRPNVTPRPLPHPEAS